MILVVELLREGLEHQAFNAGLLHAIAKAYPGAPIKFFSERNHLDAVREATTELPVEYCAIDVAPRHASIWERAGNDFRITRRILAENTEHRVIFSSITIPMLWALKFCRPPKYQIGAVLHGGLAELKRRPRFNFLKRLTGLRTAMLTAPSHVTFWVLEKGIHSELSSLLPGYAQRFSVFLHPLPPDLMHSSHNAMQNPLRIGMLGLATPQKGLHTFLKLAQEFHDKGISFEIVGRIHQDYQLQLAERLKHLAHHPNPQVMPRQEFVSKVKELSYAAFFFDGGHYSLTASGVMLDCIALGIPIVGRNHPHFDNLQKQVGEIGIFCDPGNEPELINTLLNGVDESRYQAQCTAMLNLRNERTPEALGETVKKLLYPRT